MKKITKKNFEVAVSLENREILKKIIHSAVLPPDTYLAGGTAVAMYYGHRLSDDFDFFTFEYFNQDQIMSVLKNNFFKVEFAYLLPHSIVCFLFTDKNIFTKFSLFRLPYKLIEPSVMLANTANLNDYKIQVASLSDLLCMKATAIAQRGSAKDFVDMYYLLKDTQIKFSELIRIIKIKYHLTETLLYQLKTGMNYFVDAEEKELLEKVLMYQQSGKHIPIKQKEWKEIKKYFINLAK